MKLVVVFQQVSWLLVFLVFLVSGSCGKGAKVTDAGGGGSVGSSQTGGISGNAGDAGFGTGGAGGSAGAVASSGGSGGAVVGDYYVSPTGDDSNPGTRDAPWRTLAKVNATTFSPGKVVLLQRGGTWREKLIASSSGVEGSSIEYAAYGSGPDPIIDGENAREDLIDSSMQSFLAFRHLEVQNSQASANGYGVNIRGGTGVLVEDVTIRRAMKHAIGAIQTKRFVGRRIRAYDLAPAQGFGAATTFVSYGTGAPSPDQDHIWEDCESTSGSAQYPTFITHGTGPRNITITRMVEHTTGSGLAVFAEHEATRVSVADSAFGTSIIYSGNQVTIVSTTIRGLFTVKGTNHTIRNSTITELNTNWQAGRPGAVQIEGTGISLQNNTIETGLATGNGGAVALFPGAVASLTGNQLKGDIAIRVRYDGSVAGLTSDNNVWCTIAKAQQGEINQTTYTLAQWQKLGFDSHSTTTACAAP